jgi:DEAD/DEAH box helicase domain-containing protein
MLYPVRPLLCRPVAIFLDGFSFHANEAAGRNRVARDVEQRQALVHSGRYWVWSFTWEDLHFRMDPAKIPAVLFGEDGAARRGDLARRLTEGEGLAFLQGAAVMSSWSLFLEFLQSPAAKAWTQLAYLYALTMPSVLGPVNLTAAGAGVQSICSGSPASAIESVTPHDGLGADFTGDRCVGLAVTTTEAVAGRDTTRAFFLLRFDDDQDLLQPEWARHWRGFLRLLNRLQFLPLAFVTTVRGLRAGAFPGVVDAFGLFAAGGIPAAVDSTTPFDESDAEPMALIDARVHDLLAALHEGDLSRPEVGYELVVNGAIRATAELAWEAKRIAVVLEADDAEPFQRQEWTAFLAGEQGLSPGQQGEIFAALENQHE